MEYCNLEVNG